MLMIRLRRMGAKSKPHYRVVVSDSRQTPSATALEELGTYQPSAASPLAVDRERIDAWVQKGARLSPTLQTLLRRKAS